MKKTDIGVVGFMYGVCILFFVMSMSLQTAAQTYPIFIIALLFLLTTMYLVKMCIDAKRKGVTSGKEVFDGFIARQFLVVLALIIGYLVLTYLVGFYIATAVFMAACLLFLRVPKWQIAIVIVAIIGLVYCAFTLFLRVKLPVGLLF